MKAKGYLNYKASGVEWLREVQRLMNLNQYAGSAAQRGLAIDRINNTIHVTVEQSRSRSSLRKKLYYSYETAIQITPLTEIDLPEQISDDSTQ